MLGRGNSRQQGFGQAEEEFWWELWGAGTGDGDSCKPKASWEDPPTTFISLLLDRVGSSMSMPAVWTDSSAGRKPRLSIKLGGMGPQSIVQQLIKMFL